MRTREPKGRQLCTMVIDDTCDEPICCLKDAVYEITWQPKDKLFGAQGWACDEHATQMMQMARTDEKGGE